MASARLSFDAWKEGHIRPAEQSIRVVAPRPGSKPEPVSRRLIRTLIHSNRPNHIGTVFFGPDGKWIAGGGLFGTGGIQIWDTATGKPLRSIPFPEGYLSQYQSLPSTRDGRTLVLPIQRSRQVRITQDGQPAVRWKVDGEIQMWDLATGRKLPALRHTPPRGVLGAAVTPDGSRVAAVERRVVDDGKRTRDLLTLWDVDSRTARDLAEGDYRSIPSFAPDGKTLAVSFYADASRKRGTLALWDAANGKRQRIFHTAANYYGVPSFSPDGRYLAVSLGMPNGQAPEVKIWEIATGKEVGCFTAPEKATGFTQLAFSPDGRRLGAATMKGNVFLYDLPARKLLWRRELGLQEGFLRDPVFSPDGQWLAVPGQPLPEGVHSLAEEDSRELPQPRVFLFDVSGEGEPKVVVAPHGYVGRAAFSPKGQMMALGGSGCVWLFNMSKVPE